MSTTELDTTRGYEPLTDAQERKVHEQADPWTDNFALKVAVQDFHSAEQFRSQNCDWRWRTANELYQAWTAQRYWEGSKIPRASIGVFVAFEQIESMLPKILSAIFADNPWFQADPIFRTTAEEARRWSAMIGVQMDDAHVREILRRTIKSALTYGNGIMKLSWRLEQTERNEWLPKMRQRAGAAGSMPSYERVLAKQTIKEILNRPELEFVQLEDFYVDANCASPNTRDAAFVAERKLVSVEDLAALRGVEPFKIPSDDHLIEMARSKSTTGGDQTKNSSELYRSGSFYANEDTSVDPGRKRLELIEYWTKERVVWVLNRSHCAMNAPNSYGFIPYYDAFYADVIGRFYAMGVCDIVEGEQRLQSSLLCGRLDELSLSLHPPMVKKLGIKTPSYALRVRPGQIWESEDPKNDFSFMQQPNITQNAYLETNASELRVQKTTGLSDLYGSGTPSSGGNSASRTATGIGAQVNASGARIQYIVENLEDCILQPMLNDVVTLNHLFPPVGTSMADTVAMSKIQVSMRASAKMQSRMALMQTFPLVFQTLANPGLIQELAQAQVTVNWQEVMSILLDMTGYKNRADLIRPLTKEEIERRKQPPAEQMMKMAMQKERIQGTDALTDKKLLAQSQAEELRMKAEADLHQRSEDAATDIHSNETMASLAEALIKHMSSQIAAEKKAKNGAD